MFAEHTGGRATVATNTPWEQVPQVFLENSSYYLLGIRPADGRSKGFRRVTIKVARPGAEVRSRAGYFVAGPAGASARKPPTELDQAFSGALPSGTLPLDMSAATFAAADPKQRGVVIVTTGVRRPVSASLAVETVDLRAAAFEVGGLKEVASQRTTAKLTLRPGANGERRFEIHSRLAVKPGRYEIRAAAEVPGSAGGVFTQVEVPDFSRARLSLSGLVLGLRGAALPAELAGVLPVAPTAARVFTPSAQVHAFLRVYQGGKGSLVPVQMHFRIVDASTRPIVDETTTLDAARFGSGRSADCRFELPLARLGGGDYLFSIEARAGKVVETRELRFGVRPEEGVRHRIVNGVGAW
jgi:hypothetical protein